MDLGLGGKAALGMGGSEGIGMAVARKLAQEGVRVAICARTEATLRETATEITKATGVEVIPIPADLRALAGCQGFVAEGAARLGRVDILVNNAGRPPSAPSWTCPTRPSSTRSRGSCSGTSAAPRPSSPTCASEAA